MLWLCLNFPELPLEVFTRGADECNAWVISIHRGHEQRVLICNRFAQDLGIDVGMRIGAVHALARGVRIRARDEQAERLALENIAVWGGQFTPAVSLAPPDSVLLEVTGSLSFFGGADRLLRQVHDGIVTLGYQRPSLALAPTPLAATLFARAGIMACIMEKKDLRG